MDSVVKPGGRLESLSLSIQAVRPSSTMLNSMKNPFHLPKHCKSKHSALPWKMGHCASASFRPTKKPVSLTEGFFESFPYSSTLSQSIGKESVLSDKEDTCSIKIPYIMELNIELEANFLVMEDQLATLSCEIEEYSIELPKLANPTLKTLVLDLDDTLIYVQNSDIPEEHKAIEENKRLQTISIPSEEGDLIDVSFITRPNIELFLRTLSQYFEIIIYSGGSKVYTERIVEKIDPNKEYISWVLDRSNCILRDKSLYIKDLRLLKNRDLKNIVIIDNMAFSFFNQMKNGIYIPAYEGADTDVELLIIMKFLLTLPTVPDVRPLVDDFAGVTKLLDSYRKNRSCMKAFTESKEHIEDPDDDMELEFAGELE